jgi:2'-deoxynucleoside 5'-phosphate N-hydrolase
MKIYFAGSIRGGRKDTSLYQDLINHLEIYGEVLTEHVGNKSITETGEKQIDDADIHDRDLSWLLEADVLFAEVSTPSLGVGYEIGRAVENQKMVVCLYHPQPDKELSAMIAGSPDIINIEYQSFQEAIDKIDSFFATFFRK